MIIGLGQDIVDIRRIARSLDRFGDRFTHRVFTEIERAKCDRRKARAAGYARRFAAKEAGSKALGTGVPRAGIAWRDIAVSNLPSGKPVLEFHRAAAQRLHTLIPDGLTPQVHLTLTDDEPYAMAMVIIEALPRPIGDAPG